MYIYIYIYIYTYIYIYSFKSLQRKISEKLYIDTYIVGYRELRIPNS